MCQRKRVPGREDGEHGRGSRMSRSVGPTRECGHDSDTCVHGDNEVGRR